MSDPNPYRARTRTPADVLAKVRKARRVADRQARMIERAEEGTVSAALLRGRADALAWVERELRELVR